MSENQPQDGPPAASREDGSVFRVLLGMAAIVVMVAGLRAASVFFLPLLLSLFLTIISLPLLNWLRGRRVPTVLAITLTMLAAVALLAVVGVVFSVSIDTVTEKMPDYQARVRTLLQRPVDWLEDQGVPVTSEFSPESLDLNAMVDLVSSTFRGVATAVSSIILVLLMMVFMLWESTILPGKLQAARRFGDFDPDRLQGVVARVQRYLLLKTLVSLATGVAAGVFVLAVGLDFALFWGFLAFVLNYIPNIGSILAAVPAVILALVQLGPTRAIVIAAGYLAINTVFGNLVEPALMGRGLRMSPLAIFLALIFWGWVWGPLGMILSVPLTVSLKILFENTDSLRWLAALLDRRPRQV
ncbi:MAG: AI-2E family transporter [Acidobacteriota bacterium]|jgi:predicted PurR-regulated permease PerM